jgi:RHS repeat-associated protein
MLASSSNSRPSPLPLAAGDMCEAAFGGEDPTGPRKYYRARYYDPKIGRFLNEDPLGFAEGVNFYNYVGARPTNFLDPYGLCALSSQQKECLERIFKQPVDPVKIENRPNPKSKFTATTRKNKIIVYDCDEFLKPPILLEEYYHVFEQWNRKRLFGLRYLADSAYRFIAPHQDKYWDNKYEKKAQSFATARTGEFEECMNECQK